MWGRGGEKKGRYNKTFKVQRGGWRSRKLSKLERGVGGSGISPTWKGGFEVLEESDRERKEANRCERKKEC